MANLGGWDVLIVIVASYVAIVTLVRWMRQRREEVVSQLQTRVAAEQRRKRAAERRERQQRVREQQARVRSPQSDSDQAA